MNARSATTLFGLLSLGAFGAAFAQTTPTPDTAIISNTASASFVDASGATQTATSNTVTTDVLPIYRFAITPNGTDTAGATGQDEIGAAGGTVVFTYQLENQGNTAAGNTINLAAIDSTTDDNDFGTKTIYRDNPAGGPGNVGVLDAGDFVISSSYTVPYGGVVTLFVEAAIPADAQDDESIRLNLEGRSALGAQTDLDNWAELVAFTNADLSVTKTATGNVVPGGEITYTVSGANNGGTNPYAVTGVANLTNAPAGPRNGVLISDVIPAGLTYVPGSLTESGTNNASTRVLLYSTNGGATWSTSSAGTVNAVAIFIPGTPGQRIATASSALLEYGFTFRTTVAAAIPSGTIYSNTARVQYDSNGDTDAADTTPIDEDKESTAAITTVDRSGAFTVGPFGFPNGDAPATPSYTVADNDADGVNETYTVTRSGDTQTIATAANEREVSFRHSLLNSANESDIFTLSSTLAGLPAGSVTFYAVNADGSRGALITTTLGVAAGATEEFYVVITLPEDYTSATPLAFTVTATSGDTGAVDVTTDTIGAVTEAQVVNIGNYDGTGTPNDVPEAFTVNPNNSVLIPLVVRNEGADTDIFDLALISNFPAGITTTIFDDNCDGVVNGTDAPVSSTGPLEPGTYACFIVRVSAPLTASPATYDVTVTATSRNDPAISDSITDTVTVGLVQNLTFEPDDSDVTNATVPVTYTHTITNNSNEVAVVDLSVTEPGTTGWTYTYSLDNVTFTATLPQDVSVAANGGTQFVYIRVTPAANAAEGYVDTITVTATPTYGTVVGTADSVTDTTTIDQEVFGQLELVKTVDEVAAEPGEQLTYTITGTNIGGGAITNVKINDAVPANTSFVTVSATSSFGGTVLYSTNGTTWTTDPTALTVADGTPAATGSTLYVGVSTNGDNTISAADSFPGTGTPPAGVITMTLIVTIN